MSLDIPQRIKWALIIILICSLLIPHIVGSSSTYIQYVGNQPLRPLSIDHLITHYSSEYDVDEKLARDIIYCESRFYADAINKDTAVGEDVGLFQLNSYYWQEVMAKLEWDIYEIEDNIEAGIWLMSIEGSKPWYASEFCWSKR